MLNNDDDDVFEKLLKNEMYQNLLKQLPKDEQVIVKNSLKELVNLFENNVLNVIKNFEKK